MAESLVVWAIYRRPGGEPDEFIVQGFDLFGRLHHAAMATDSLADARALIPPGLHPLRNAPGGDPLLIEAWL